MSSPTSTRAAKRLDLLRAMQLMTGQSVLLSQAIADTLGINSTDLEALGAVQAGLAMTAGDLSTATGLTTGAVTTVIDRLEHAGFLRREDDPGDRRKVLLRLRPEKAKRVIALYAGLESGMNTLLSKYSDKDVELLTDFLAASTKLAEQHLAALQAGTRRRSSRALRRRQVHGP